MRCRTPIPSRRRFATEHVKLVRVLAVMLACGGAQAAPALPEPPVILYGQVSPSSPAPDLATVSLTLTGNGESLTTPAPAQVVAVDSQSFYLVRVPFETRSIQGGPTLAATLGTLALTNTATSYTLTAKVGNQNATLPAGSTTLTYGTQQQGLVQRIDLTLGGETYDQWSQRLFGSLVSQTADADGDGRTNYQEYLAGTNPTDPNSRLAVTAFAPGPGGGFSLTWETQAGKTYRVERATNLDPGAWTVLQGGISGDGSSKTFTDPNPGTAPRLFYRIVVGE